MRRAAILLCCCGLASLANAAAVPMLAKKTAVSPPPKKSVPHRPKLAPKTAPKASVSARTRLAATPIEAGERDSTSAPLSESRASVLHEQLLSILHERPLSRARVGLVVMRASDGVVLFSHNPERAFNPASNTKMLTTASAIATLGGDYRYRTTLHGPAPDDNGLIRGDVTLRGMGDPSLGTNDLTELAEHLRALGVRRIEGDLWVDSTFHSDGMAQSPEPPGSALILDRNLLTVHIEPGELKRAPRVWIEPGGEHFVIDNKAVTQNGRRSRLNVSTFREGERIVVSVRGRIAQDRGEYIDKQRLGDGALLAGWTLRSALAAFDIELVGAVRLGTLSDEARVLLASHESSPMSDICKIANKPSNNFVSEVIFKTVGAEVFGWPGTFQKGARAVAQYLNRMGLSSSSFRLVNGSGLTHENRITPSALALLLRRIYFDLAVAPDFLNSLAIGGIDGTIKHRFLGTEAVGLVRAKTGTLSGVSALSGYVGEKDDVLIFSIFVEGFRSRAKNDVRRAQVRMVTGMLRYLRRTPLPPPLPASPHEPVDDIEADGDPA